MESVRLSLTVEEAQEHLGISRALADGETFREEPTAFTGEVGISDRTLTAALKELETAKLIVGTFQGGRKKYSAFVPLQPLHPIYNTLQGLQKSQPGNNELIDFVHPREPSNDLFSEKNSAPKTNPHLW